MDADRRGGADTNDDVGRRLRRQPPGPVCDEPDGFPPRLADAGQRNVGTTKLFTMLGTYIHKYHGSRYYGKAMNITRRLTAAYDAALATNDLLLMPTTPIKATPLPPADAPRELYVSAR